MSQYYNQNREERLEYQRMYNEKNAERIKEYKAKYSTHPDTNPYLTCECGSVIRKLCMWSHLRSARHSTQLALKK